MKKIIWFLIFIILINPVLALVYTDDERIDVNYWREYDILEPDGSVDVTIGIVFRLMRYGSKENLSFRFSGRIIDKADNFEAYLCDKGLIDFEEEGINILCLNKKQKISVETKKVREHIEYFFNLNTKDINKSKRYILEIRYVSKNFIEDEGDYHVAPFSSLSYFRKEEDPIDIRRWVLLPKETSMLDKIPDNAQIYRANNKWRIILEDDDAKFIRFIDSKELDNKNRKNMLWGAFYGAIFGIGFSFIFESFIWRKRRLKRPKKKK